MTIYVDNARIHADVVNKETGRVVSGSWSHLISDQLNPEELHQFATGVLKLRRSYFQPGRSLLDRKKHEPSGDHYDLTAPKASLAVKCGAISISAVDLSAIVRLKKMASRLEYCVYKLVESQDSQWLVALEWGSEADDSPMVGAAAYGIGESIWDAVEMAIEGLQ